MGDYRGRGREGREKTKIRSREGVQGKPHRREVGERQSTVNRNSHSQPTRRRNTSAPGPQQTHREASRTNHSPPGRTQPPTKSEDAAHHLPQPGKPKPQHGTARRRVGKRGIHLIGDAQTILARKGCRHQNGGFPRVLGIAARSGWPLTGFCGGRNRGRKASGAVT